MQIEHIGIAVKDLELAVETYTRLLGQTPYKYETVESEKVTTAFFKVGESKIELLAATDDSSPIATYIAKKGEGVHHVAFRVDDINKQINYAADAGFKVLGNVRAGAENMLVNFLHPADTHKVLIEFCQPK